LIDQLPPELADLIAAESEAPVADAAARAAIHARVVASASGTAGAVATGKLLALILGIGAVGTIAVLAWPHANTPRPVLRETPTVAVQSARDQTSAPTPTAIATVSAAPSPTPLPAVSPPRARVPRPATEPSLVASNVAAAPTVAPAVPALPPPSEADLLSDASHALATGDTANTLALIDQDTALYPSGAMAEERDDLRARALAAAGRMDEARGAVARFRVTYPHSVYLRALLKDVTP